MTIDHAALLNAADAAAAKAYVPYSKFHVGAALLAEDGTIFPGCNVENVSYGLTNCAERTAIYSAVVSGHQRFTAIAIVQGSNPVGNAEPCWPCGACRQVLSEFNPDLEVIFREGNGHRVTSLRELLPHSFDAQRLQVR
jgi:cytidine deaminase